MSSLRLKAYRNGVSLLANRLSRARGAGTGKVAAWTEGNSRPVEALAGNESGEAGFEKARLVWMHAASVGELEMLWPVAEELGSRGFALTLSVFSSSAIGAVSKLAESLNTQGATVLYSGFSPVEGQWADALAKVNPGLFVTAKYEAWPELWASLSERGTPLAIVGARDRKSLKLGKFACRALGYDAPRLLMTTARAAEAHSLTRKFSRSRVAALGEPRWDRVASRLKNGNPRAKRLISILSSSPRPWGILGSSWPEDLDVLKDAIMKVPGTVWIVPHRVDASSVEDVLKQVSTWAEAGGPPLRTSLISESVESRVARIVVVDEMGFLSELYGAADWAYVGGGFGKGLHSVIEPAIAGLPIAGGPSHALEFPEVLDLLDSGEMTLIESEGDAWRWAESLASGELLSTALRERRRSEAKARLGAAQRVADALIQHAGWQPGSIR